MRAQTTVGLCRSVRERQCPCPSASYNPPCRSIISRPSANNNLPHSTYHLHVPLPATIFHADLPFYAPLPATIFHAISVTFMSLCQQQSSTQYLPFHVPLPATIFHTVSTISCPSASNNLPRSIYHFMSLCQQQSSMQYLPFWYWMDRLQELIFQHSF